MKYPKPEKAASPVYCSLYWEPEQKKWVPWEFDMGITTLIGRRDLVF